MSQVATGPLKQVTAHVLVITQDADVKSFVEKLMLHRRVRAGVTDSTGQASWFLSNNPAPDLLILDLDLPDKQALEFLRRIRLHTELAKLPVLVLTSFSDPALVREALNLGANRYITKMFMDKNLLTTILEMLS